MTGEMRRFQVEVDAKSTTGPGADDQQTHGKLDFLVTWTATPEASLSLTLGQDRRVTLKHIPTPPNWANLIFSGSIPSIEVSTTKGNVEKNHTFTFWKGATNFTLSHDRFQLQRQAAAYCVTVQEDPEAIVLCLQLQGDTFVAGFRCGPVGSVLSGTVQGIRPNTPDFDFSKSVTKEALSPANTIVRASQLFIDGRSMAREIGEAPVTGVAKFWWTGQFANAYEHEAPSVCGTRCAWGTSWGDLSTVLSNDPLWQTSKVNDLLWLRQ